MICPDCGVLMADNSTPDEFDFRCDYCGRNIRQKRIAQMELYNSYEAECRIAEIRKL